MAKGARPFSRLEALENLLGAAGELMVGYPGLKAREYFTRFSGRVTSYRLEAEKLTLTLRARLMLDTTFKISPEKRGRLFRPPKPHSQAAPDLRRFDPSAGKKAFGRAVSLDREGFVYALAGHRLLPLSANGNRVSLSRPGRQPHRPGDPTPWILTHDYHGPGNQIATATFFEDPSDLEPVYHPGKGKARTARAGFWKTRWR